MKEDLAVRFLDDVFINAFNPGRYTHFIQELFNDFRVFPQRLPIWHEFKNYIDEAYSIGTYFDGKHTIGVLYVRLRRSTSRDRARTMQRNFIAKFLNNEGKDAVLVAFYGDDHDDWRFSFVRLEHTITTGDDGRIRTNMKLTPARRFSFLVGKHEPNHTCRKQFLDLIKEEQTNPVLAQIEDRFSVENVTDEFFEKYKGCYLNLKESLERALEADPICRAEFEEKEISTVDFSKKLLGQIVFLYFLQKKGWLGVRRDAETGKFQEWGMGPKDFMRRLYDGEIVPYKNFFNDILEPLFYEALAENRSISEDFYSKFECKIPFLNGGLFEPTQNYNWFSTNLWIENEVFGDILKTFDEFNFTIKEDEPLEREVAIDPEMLGKVFEKLLDVTDRKSKGAFYTPRDIVHYMCQESLIGYLTNHTEIPREDLEVFIRHGDVALGMTLHHLETGGQDEEWYRDARFTLPESIQNHYAELDRLLCSIKVADPAVGSGAFPVGMMNEIVKARSILTPFFAGESADRSIYELKRQTIENSLYGVDIDSSAVDITKLRFWLSLIVDEENIATIRPLPNLDHKIMCGNSLVDEFEGVSLFDEKLLSEPDDDREALVAPIDARIEELGEELHQILTGALDGDSAGVRREIARQEKKKKEILAGPKTAARQITFDQTVSHRVKVSRRKLRELKKYQRLFFNEQNRAKKNEYRATIEQMEWDLIEETLKESGNADACTKLTIYRKNRAKPFFLWKLYFSEVFLRPNPGFDVVLANPPYVRQEELGKEFKDYLKGHYSCYSGKADLYVYFIERGHQLLRDMGVFCYICSNKYMKTGYGENLRLYLSTKTEIKEIIDFGELPLFKSASTFPSILLTVKQEVPTQKVTFAQLKRLGYLSLDEEVKVIRTVIPEESLKGTDWVIASHEELQTLHKLSENTVELSGYVRGEIFYGIKTGLNPAFVIDTATKNRLIAQDPSSADLIVPFLNGDDIRKYRIDDKGQYLILIKKGWTNQNSGSSPSKWEWFKENYPAISNHLEPYAERAKKRSDKGDYWWELRACSYYDKFVESKIVYPEMAMTSRFVLDFNQYYLNKTCFFIPSSENYLLGLLNSKLIWFYLKHFCSVFGDTEKGGRLLQQTIYMGKIPIRPIDPANPSDVARYDRIVALVEQMLDLSKRFAEAEAPHEKEVLAGTIDATGRQIDRLVYELYGLTEDEVAVVEGSV